MSFKKLAFTFIPIMLCIIGFTICLVGAMGYYNLSKIKRTFVPAEAVIESFDTFDVDGEAIEAAVVSYELNGNKYTGELYYISDKSKGVGDSISIYSNPYNT